MPPELYASNQTRALTLASELRMIPDITSLTINPIGKKKKINNLPNNKAYLKSPNNSVHQYIYEMMVNFFCPKRKKRNAQIE
jgi:hypothetical protein